MAIDIELDMRVDPENEVTMSVDDGDEVNFGVGETVVIKNHAILDNRDLPDQHPISAITGLQEALDNCGAIDTIKVNGTALSIVNKAVDITVPTEISDLDDDFVYDIGEIPHSSVTPSVFSITAETRTEVLDMVGRARGSKCAILCLYDTESYTLDFIGFTLLQGVQYAMFADYTLNFGLGGSIFIVGISLTTNVGGLTIRPLITIDDVDTELNATIDYQFLVNALGFIPYPDSNPDGFITSSDVPVASVNGKTGAVVLDASDVNALPNNTPIPTKTSDLTNDSGFVTHDNETEQAYISNPSSYTYWRGLAIGASEVSSESGALSTTTDKVYVVDSIRVQPSTGTIKATTFKGDLTGTASGNLVASDLVAITTAEIDALFV